MFFARNASSSETATTGIAKLHSPSFDPFDPYKQFRKTDSGHNPLDSSRSINVFQQIIKIKDQTRQDSFDNHSSYVDGYQYDYKSIVGSQKPDFDLPHSYLSAESAPPSPPSSTISSNKPKKSQKTTVPQAENSQFIIGKNKVVNGVYTLMRRRSKYTLNSSK